MLAGLWPTILMGGRVDLLVRFEPEVLTGISLPGQTASTSVVYAAVTGGVAPYSYAWSWASGGEGISTSDPAAQSTFFGVTANAEQSGVARCRVTDAAGNTGEGLVQVTFSYPF